MAKKKKVSRKRRSERRDKLSEGVTLPFQDKLGQLENRGLKKHPALLPHPAILSLQKKAAIAQDPNQEGADDESYNKPLPTPSFKKSRGPTKGGIPSAPTFAPGLTFAQGIIVFGK